MTGFICDGPEELPAALLAAERARPGGLRGARRGNFSVERMAYGYEEVYRRFAPGRHDVREPARVPVR